MELLLALPHMPLGHAGGQGVYMVDSPIQFTSTSLLIEWLERVFN
jgi:hypothetical protein